MIRTGGLADATFFIYVDAVPEFEFLVFAHADDSDRFGFGDQNAGFGSLAGKIFFSDAPGMELYGIDLLNARYFNVNKLFQAV
ncbi:MAG: hypothetical protein GX629_03005 [Phycisphaerae bacterium]|nr:hypothetical protein [Phycisphaerae bacterium]